MQILSDKNPLETYVEAAHIAYRAVAHTLGPGGTNTAVVNKKGSHDIINDGYSILSKLTSLDPAESEALETVKLAAFETNRKAGDGTTSTTILTYRLLDSAKKYLENTKITKVKLRNLLEDTRDQYIDTLHQSMSREIKDEDYESIAKVSLGGPKYANIISEAYRFLPEGLRPSVVRSDIPNVILDKKDGIVLDKAEVIAPEDTFIHGPKEYNDVDVYLIYDKLDRWNMIQPIVEQIIRLKRKAILFYNELSMDILQNLQLQIVKGYADIIPIRLGSLGVQTRTTMNQLALYTDTTLIDGVEVRLPKALNQVKIGKIDYILISHDAVIINNKDFTDLDSITLPTKSCIIRVGGINNAEMEENYRRIEDAVNSLGNAIESGISIGAGITYQRLALSDDSVPEFIREAMESVYRTIIYNITGEETIKADLDGLVIADSGEYKLADDLKIFDATKVIEQVIVNSFTLVAQIITTNEMIVENIR
jgi:chaperonin GroEL